MHVIYLLLVAAHLVGMAVLVGGWVAVAVESVTPKIMVWGARLQLVSGLLLVGLWEMGARDGSPDHVKIAVKLLIALAVVAAAEIGAGRLRRGAEPKALLNTAGVLALVNVLVAVFW